MATLRDPTTLPAREAESQLLHVVIETPRGSRSKFRYDEKLGLFRLSKFLPRGAIFPFDFGFIPSTRAEDGDPLDVLVLMEQATFSGCLVTTRLLGVIEAKQTERGKSVRNDRLIGIPETPKIRPSERSLDDLPAGLLDQVEHFFRSYNEMEGRTFKPLRRGGVKAAHRLVEEAERRFRSSGSGRG
jgi:inorganic pyrophosphatase